MACCRLARCRARSPASKLAGRDEGERTPGLGPVCTMPGGMAITTGKDGHDYEPEQAASSS